MPETRLHDGLIELRQYYRNQVCLTTNLWLGANDLAAMILDLESDSQAFLLDRLASDLTFVTRLLQHVNVEQRLKIIQEVLKD